MSDFHYKPITSAALMEYLIAGNCPEYLERINTFCKYHIDTHKTLKMNAAAIRKELETNNRAGIYFKGYGTVYVDHKPGPKGHKGYYTKKYGVELYCSFYSAVMYVLNHTPCFTWKQYRSEQMEEYWKSRKDEDIANLVIGNEWSKFEAHQHLTNLEYQRMLEWESEGIEVFRKEHKPHKQHKSRFNPERVEEIKRKLQAGERLTQVEKNFKSSHKDLFI